MAKTFPTEQDLFLIKEKEKPFIVPATKTFSYPIILMARLLEETYIIDSKEMTLVEKNKGDTYEDGRFSSSHFSLTTEIRHSTDKVEIHKFRTFLTEHSITFKGSTAQLLQYIYDNFQWILYRTTKTETAKIEQDQLAPNVEAVRADDIHSHLVQYHVFDCRLRSDIENNEWNLNSFDRAIYLAIVTKFIENYANREYKTSAEFSNTEYSNLVVKYERFLFECFTKYVIMNELKLETYQ